MHVPDIEFHVIALPHTEAGRKWLADRMMPHNAMFSGVAVRSVECANNLGNEAIVDGLRICGLVEQYTYEGREVRRSGR
jgi:hypothetical protein